VHVTAVLIQVISFLPKTSTSWSRAVGRLLDAEEGGE
jgi:hypothetical protein